MLTVNEYGTLTYTGLMTWVTDIPGEELVMVQELLDADQETKEGVAAKSTAKRSLRESAVSRARRLKSGSLDVDPNPLKHMKFARGLI